MGVVEPVIRAGQNDIRLAVIVAALGVWAAMDIARLRVVRKLVGLACEAAPHVRCARLAIPDAAPNRERKNAFATMAIAVQCVVLAHFVIETHYPHRSPA